MKIIKHIFRAFLMVMVLASCDEDLSIVTFDAGQTTASVLSAIDAEIILEADDEDEPAVTFQWNHSDFGYAAAVTYELQVDVKDQAFAHYEVVASLAADKEASTMSYQAVTKDLNKLLLDLLEKYEALDGSEPVDFSFRVVASISVDDKLVSNVIDSKITVYTGRVPSIYMIGAAVGGWNTDLAVEVAWAGLPDVYQTIAYFDAETDANFRFFNSPAWAGSMGGYNLFTNYPTDLLGETGDGDANFLFIGTTGWYNITVNVATGTIEMTAVAEPLLYLTGDATHGWNWDEPVTSLQWVGHQIWAGQVTFIQNNYFRLFEQKDWGPIHYGHNLITGYDTNYIIIAEGHGDPNWQFVAASGVYDVRVDKRMGTMVITPAQ